jgi:hypothetical protein
MLIFRPFQAYTDHECSTTSVGYVAIRVGKQSIVWAFCTGILQQCSHKFGTHVYVLG